jgi:hypothetical protein
MRNIILILCLFVLGLGKTFCAEPDYRQIYLNLQVPTFSYVHGIDPGQYYDNKDAAYSIYPLFRLSTPLYFKTITILPGYYDLTPVSNKGQDYLLFKDCGIVKYIIPVYKKELVPLGFYESHLPKPKLTLMQKMNKGFYNFLGKHVASAQRKEPVKTYIDVHDLDNQLVLIIIYYADYKYYTIYRTVQI